MTPDLLTARLVNLRPRIGPREERRDNPLRDRTIRVRINGDIEHCQALRIPSPRRLAIEVLAPTLGASLDVFRRGREEVLVRPAGAREARPESLDLEAVAGTLGARLAALPSSGRDDLATDLRTFAEHGNSEAVVAYCRDAARALLHPSVTPREYREPRPTSPRASGRAKTPAERKAEQRERDETRERLSAEVWVRGFYLDPDAGDPPPVGEKVLASALYRQAAASLAALGEDEEPIGDYVSGPEWADEAVLAVPRKAVFFSVADHLLGPRRHTERGAAYTIPAPERVPDDLVPTRARRPVQPPSAERKHMTIEDLRAETAVLRDYADQAERVMTARERLASGDRFGALIAQRERLAATGTDGAPVVDLASRRRAGR